MNTSQEKIFTRSMTTLTLAFMMLTGKAQQSYRQTGFPVFTIAGTSTLHDWKMTSQGAIFQATLETGADGALIKLTCF